MGFHLFRTVGWQGMLLVVALAFSAPWLVGLPRYTTSTDVLHAPGLAHWLGTNDLGQDVLAGLLVATPATLGVAFLASALSFSLALIFAGIAALRLPILSEAVLRLVDILQALPGILIILLLAAWIRPNFLGLVCLLSAVSWHEDVRVLRALILRELTRDNVQFARNMGASWSYCFLKHIFPALTSPAVGLLVQNVCGSIMRTAGLGFLGLTDARLVTWGSMMGDAMPYLYEPAWSWLLLPPVICISLTLSILMNATAQFGVES